MSEALTSALHSAEFVRQDLQRAYKDATPLEALVIYPLLEDAVKVAQRIAALIEATR